MKFNGKIILMAITIAMLLVTAQSSWAPVSWEITDGDPDYYMSDAIVVRNSPEYSWPLDVPDPVGLDWQDPIAGQINYVWVRVGRIDPFDVPQTGKLRLFIGRAGTLFEAPDYEPYPPNPAPNADILSPPDSSVWTQEQWDGALLGSAVVPVRRHVGPNWATEYDLDSLSPDTPVEDGVRWLQFAIEPYRLPSTASNEEMPFSLVAYIHDTLDYDGGNVMTDSNMAERRFNVLEIDYGDAPDPTYPTLLASDGARHLATGPMLGATRDGEADGQSAVDADGDDAAGMDDEDGVVFHDPPVPGAVVLVDVTASIDGFLNAWVDFNLDGDWDDAGEQIFNDQAVAAGVNNLSFNVPDTASTTATPYARFRINSTGGLSPTGQASDGEVEDHLVQKPPEENKAKPWVHLLLFGE